MKKESDAYVNKQAQINISWRSDSEGKISFTTNLKDFQKDLSCTLIKTDDIPMAFEPEEKYENPDGSPITFDTDFYGKQRGENIISGPFAI